MLKLELLLRRIRGFDAKRMMVYVRDVKKETKTPTPVIMVICSPCRRQRIRKVFYRGSCHVQTK